MNWLSELSKTKIIKPISRAHLPRLLEGLNWVAVNKLIERCFGVQLQDDEIKKWIAIDGKAIRGTLDAGEKQNIVLAVDSEELEDNTLNNAGYLVSTLTEFLYSVQRTRKLVLSCTVNDQEISE